MEKPSHIDLITAFTGLSDSEQCQACFDSAYAWLELVLEPDRYGMEMLPLQASFWSWWIRHWSAIDHGFLESVKVQEDGKILVRLPGQETYTEARSSRHLATIWQEYHNPCFVNGNQDLLRRSFHQYIKNLVNSKQ